MILTETLFRKISSFTLVKETESHIELMAQATAVLKQAHKRGVELEYVLEVRTCMSFYPFPFPFQQSGLNSPWVPLDQSCILRLAYLT